MAWNRPNNDGRANTPGSPRRAGTARPTVAARGAIAGAIVVVGAAVAAWWLWPDASAPVAEDGDGTVGRRIREAKPAVAKRGETPRPREEAKPAVDPNYRPTRPGEIANGYRMLADGTLRKIHGIITNSPARITLADKTFDCSSDRKIGNLLLVEPGAHFLGASSQYYWHFEEEFRESLKTPIVIVREDDEDTKWIKREVLEIRKELKQRMDAGEDIGQIMRDSREQLREVSLYKDDIVKMVREHGMDLDNQRDYEDLIGAANKMLEERGAPALSMPSTLKAALRQWRDDLADDKKEEK